MAHRSKVRQALAEDPEWLEVVKRLIPMVMRMENKILNPAPFSPMK